MIIFLGSVYPQSLLTELSRRKLFADYPADIFQHSLLMGLDAHHDDLRVVSSPVIRASYSSVKDICGRCMFSHKNYDEDKKDVCVGSLPIPGLQMLVELWRVYWTTRKMAAEARQKPNLIIYALHSPFLMAAVMLKKKLGTTCVVVPDLPEFMSKRGNIIKRMGKKIDSVIINSCLKRLNSFVLLSPYMRDKLPIKDKPWVLMEGIFDTNTIPQPSVKSKERIVLYCGSISRQYGIVQLLQAFTKISSDNYRLWICGRGDGEDDVISMAKDDTRIKYFGVVSHGEVLVLQQRATVLINPRSSAGEYTKYSFPSKTMEYLASGTPTIMCHLPAIPKEYDDYVFYIADESVEGIKNKIEEVCNMKQEELDDFGKKAALFIKTKKNAFIQAEKILKLLAETTEV